MLKVYVRVRGSTRDHSLRAASRVSSFHIWSRARGGDGGGGSGGGSDGRRRRRQRSKEVLPCVHTPLSSSRRARVCSVK